MDPLVLFLGCGSGDAVHHVVPLHHPSVGLCLARFDQLTAVVGDVELEAILKRGGHSVSEGGSCRTGNMLSLLETYRLPGVFHFTDAEVLQRNDASWFLVLWGETYFI